MQAMIPDIPGTPVTNPLQLQFLREHVSQICNQKSPRYPGTQPVSFDKSCLNRLLTEDFWVCEKSDGQRVLVLIVVRPDTGIQEVFLIDRKNMYYQVHGMFFPPLSSSSQRPLTNTILDGELVVDTLAEGQTMLRLLLFDCLVMDGVNVTQRPFSRRYASLLLQLLPSFQNYLKFYPDARMMHPFEIQVKHMDLAHGIQMILEEKIPQLLHGNDGLIFTGLDSKYVYGSNTKILKWKPPQENTIDFQLQLRFPPDLKADASGTTPDLRAKPTFQLWQHESGDTHVPFDYLDMDDEEWEKWKQSGEQLDDRIVECAWYPPSPDDPSLATWHIKRIRDDKTTANHKTTVSRILQSIRDGVSEEELVQIVPSIRTAWKSPQRELHRNELFRSAPANNRPPRYKGTGGPPGPQYRGGFPRCKR